MKLFQSLLVAPAALGLMAPLAASAADLNLQDLSDYSSSSETAVNSAPSFSDVVPGDWAYTALQSLSESYGCVDNAYTKNLKSGQALTRYEAAALVNACLDSDLVANGQGVNADAVRLADEFGSEMAILKGRVDGLENNLNEFNAGQFASTTKLTGKVVFNTGALSDGEGEGPADASWGADKLTSTYVATYNINTSFTGEDRLYTRIKSGNMTNTPWENATYGTHLADAYKSTSATALEVDKLWYEFPIGDFKVWAGPRIENYYMLASAPSIYKPVLKQFALGGNAATYGSSTDGGFGFAWTQPTDDRSQARFAVSSNYVSKGATNASTGILTDGQTKWLSKVEYGSPRWQVSAAVALNSCITTSSCKNWAEYYSTKHGGNVTGNSTAYALRAYWKPASTGAIPAIQVGLDWVNVDDDGTATVTEDPGYVLGSTEAASSWMAGFVWKDIFQDGNSARIAFGQPQKATTIKGGGSDPAKSPFTWEAAYDWKVTDGITITPSVFGAEDRTRSTAQGDDWFGALIQTTFKF